MTHDYVNIYMNPGGPGGPACPGGPIVSVNEHTVNPVIIHDDL